MTSIQVFTSPQTPDMVYDGTWHFTSASKGTSDEELNLTLEYEAGDGPVALFHSTGVQLIISGIIVYTNDTIPVLEFTVDNSSTTVFTPQAVKNGSITSFYRSPRLSDDKHEVRLNIAKFTPSAGALNSGGHKLGGEMLDVATNSTTEGEGTGHTVAPIGPIIGGTIGGLVLLAASVLVIYLWNANRRKNRRPYIYYAAPLDEIDSEKVSIVPSSDAKETCHDAEASMTATGDRVSSRLSHHDADYPMQHELPVASSHSATSSSHRHGTRTLSVVNVAGHEAEDGASTLYAKAIEADVGSASYRFGSAGESSHGLGPGALSEVPPVYSES